MALLALLLAAAGGCEAISYLAQGMPSKEKAAYRLADVPTVVMVDDPQGLLEDGALRSKLAAGVGGDLEANKAVKTIVPQARLEELARTLGPGYGTTPMDEVGRRLGAGQVVHVLVESKTMRVDPGAFRPTLAMRVRVIDAVAGKRVFPPRDQAGADDPVRPTRGHLVEANLYYQSLPDESKTGTSRLLEELVARASRDVGRLFYDYQARQPGEPFE